MQQIKRKALREEAYKIVSIQLPGTFIAFSLYLACSCNTFTNMQQTF